ncbi:hypothetical protein MDA_GLEAN10001324 [Myotis davidii]|uniref:Ig-like domain-containing protein n=1 Tax=Myotis davidii TaxID=225400 RepID=L5MK47_MYODS|nr:hypothetical protein MDA_GLEAN10001324 [Myotis davidii]
MNIQFIFTSLLALALSGPGGADWIKPQETEVSGTEGESVKLLCNYGTSSRGTFDLYWFRQYPNQALEFILYRGWGYTGKGDAEFAIGKFYSDSSADTTNLYFRKLEFADTARYHCALRKPR